MSACKPAPAAHVSHACVVVPNSGFWSVTYCWVLAAFHIVLRCASRVRARNFENLTAHAHAVRTCAPCGVWTLRAGFHGARCCTPYARYARPSEAAMPLAAMMSVTCHLERPVARWTVGSICRVAVAIRFRRLVARQGIASTGRYIFDSDGIRVPCIDSRFPRLSLSTQFVGACLYGQPDILRVFGRSDPQQCTVHSLHTASTLRHRHAHRTPQQASRPHTTTRTSTLLCTPTNQPAAPAPDPQ
jgi:hypothetical protein